VADAWFDFETGSYAAFTTDPVNKTFGNVSGASLNIDAVRVVFTTSATITASNTGFLLEFSGGGF
jgi:hypothetical protein